MKKRSLISRLSASSLELALAIALLVTPPGSAFANPLGGQPKAGQVVIGPVDPKAPNTLTITQSSQSAIINWQSFNIGPGEITQFIQPNANAVILNRVTGSAGPSFIYGTITANGRVFLVNPDGILFGLGSRVDASSFLASTNDIRNHDFMHGHYRFDIPGRLDASIVNLGRINAANGGFAALVAPGVRNAGVITANLGHVALASGNGFTLDFYGDKLITLQVHDSIAGQVIDVATGQPLNALVKNEGRLRANGGTVALTAVAARQVVDAVINNSGVIEANSVGTKNGMIVLGAATATRKPQDAPTQNVVVSGTLSAKGRRDGETGGTIVVTGEAITLTGARVNASGAAGGGSVLIGGDTGGGHVNAAAANIPQAKLQPWWVATATSVSIDAATTINASATQKGDGGKVVVWSNGITSVMGLIAASGGPFGGNGGFVETSGHSVNFDGIRVNTSAPNGTAGLWLVDPTNLVVDAAAAATISSNLANTDVTLITSEEGASGPGNQVLGAGDIIVNAGISWSSGSTLTLSAFNGIIVNAPITIQGAGGLNIATGIPVISFGNGASVQFTGMPNSGQTLVINGVSRTLIYSMNDLQAINASSASLGGSYALAKPIDATGVTGWVPIGTNGAGVVLNDGRGFTGVLSGLGNTISNLTINSPSANYVGLFGYVGGGGRIFNVGLVGGSVTGQNYVGALVGQNNGGTLTNVYSTAAVNGRGDTGGLIGLNSGPVTNAYATGAVSATGPVSGDYSLLATGGLIGSNSGTLLNVYATGPVTTSGDGAPVYVGGLIGFNNGTVTNAYATGTVTASGGTSVGGLIGINFGPVTNTYATGAVSNSGSPFAGVGGLVGFNSDGGAISQSYASGAVNGGSSAGGLVGFAFAESSITQSYATGSVSGASNAAGGLVGVNSGTITYSYATGAVSGAPNMGGLVAINGANDFLPHAEAATFVNGTVAYSYWDRQTTRQTHSAGSDDSFGLTTAQFGNPGNFAGWTFGAWPGASGWVIIDADGSFNGAGEKGQTGATRPMLLSEWTSTIVNAHQLQLISLNPSATYTLASNIDLAPALSNPSDVWAPGAGAGFIPIGNYNNPFTGTFNGNNHTISNLTINLPSLAQVGLFSDVGDGGVIRNVGLIGGSVNGWREVGALVGANEGDITHSYASVAVTGHEGVGGLVGLNNGRVRHSHASGQVQGTGGDDVGGLVGYNEGGTIARSYATGDVSGPLDVGGLVGDNSFGTIKHSYATGTVSGTNVSDNFGVGGLVGYMFDGVVSKSYATGDVSAPSYVGGLVGWSDGSSGSITRSYASGAVSGSSYVGGLVGYNGAAVSDVHASGAVAGTYFSNYVGGLIGANVSGGVVSDAYAIGPVSGGNQVGGLVGGNQGSISQSFATGMVTGTSLTGGLVGSNGDLDGHAGTITQSYATGTVSGGDRTGGLVGENFSGTISTSYALGAVNGFGSTGGLVGTNLDTITQSYAAGAVFGINDVGGLVGSNHGWISQSYALGAVSSADGNAVGGLVGTNGGTIDQSYATGAVIGLGDVSNVGGFIGFNNGSISASFWDVSTSRFGAHNGVGNQSDAPGVTGLTTAQFGTASIFINAGWTFGTTPGASGWVIVDTNGSLNNAGNAAGATRPMLLAEWSSTITNAHQLELANLDLGAHYRLAANIDLGAALANPSEVFAPNGAAGFVPIGSIGTPFTGRFNGHNHTIAGLTIAPTDASVTSIGLFGANVGTIRNLNLIDVSITANPNVGLPGQFVGTVTGQNFGLISNVTASGTINGLDLAGVIAGGLVGQNGSLGADTQSARITRSHADVDVTLGNGILCMGGGCNGGFNNAGGLVGFNVATIDRSSASGTITVGANTFAGGLVGTNQNANFPTEGPPVALDGPHISDSWASGNVVSSAGGVALGGLVGYNAPRAGIWNSHATGNVISTVARTADCSPDCPVANAGGLVGQNQGEILGHRLPSADSDCTAGFTCASGFVTVGAGGTGGGLVGENQGIIRNAFATGDVFGAAGPGSKGSFDHLTTLGGLVGTNQGIISHTFATGAVGAGATLTITSGTIESAGVISFNLLTDKSFSLSTDNLFILPFAVTPVNNLNAGGLVGDNGGVISHSRAFGLVMAGANSVAGGLAGDNNPSSAPCPGCTVGDGFNQLALISHSAAFGNVTVGSNSVAGGLVAINSGTVRHARAGGTVTGGDNSVVAGLVGINGLDGHDGLIEHSLAWGPVTDSGPNSIVAGLVGVNAGTVRDSRSRAAVTGGSDSYVGGLVGINAGVVQDSSESGAVVATGGGNVTGGFAALNLGFIDPSIASGSIDGGSNSITGGFAGGNVNVPNPPAGFSLPGIISNDSTYNGPSTPYQQQQIASTSITPNYPTPPAFLAGCGAALCSLFGGGGPFNPGAPSTPVTPPTTPFIDTPPPAQLVVTPANDNNTTQPTVVNLTTTPGNGGPGDNGGNGGNAGNRGNNGGPPTGPPPGPGLDRTYDEQHFSGVPPLGETRFREGEIVVQISDTIPVDDVLKVAQQLGMTLISSQHVELTHRGIYRFRAASGKDIRRLILALEKNRIVASAQPNYKFILGQNAPAVPAAPPAVAPPAQTNGVPPKAEPAQEPGLANADTASLESLPAGDAAQYVVDKMHLAAVHHLASGRNVVVAVIDSEIDINHPDLRGVIVDRFDATQSPSRPHVHGTGMAGAIAARKRLLGVAPNVRLIAIKAFDEQSSSAEATSYQILKGLDYAIEHRARIINMSFAGPRDPMMERTLKIAHDKGIILVAAAGNAGPKSPPLYPGADPSVIAVSASDYNDAPFRMANRGRYIAVAAPGVDVMVPAPGNTYQLTTGTSVASAHVSGVAALLVERKPNITPDEVRALLMRTATPFSARPKGEEDGAGLVDPVAALEALGPGPAAQAAPRPGRPTVH
jgi:filamentous hemagglutinin family protein